MVARSPKTDKKTEDVYLDVDEVKTLYKPKEREIKAFKVGTKQPDWFKAVIGKDIQTFLPPIKDPLNYDVEVNKDLVVILPSGQTFNAGSWIVKDVDGFHGYTDKDFKKLFKKI